MGQEMHLQSSKDYSKIRGRGRKQHKDNLIVDYFVVLDQFLVDCITGNHKTVTRSTKASGCEKQYREASNPLQREK